MNHQSSIINHHLKTLISIIGSTGIGKTKLAIEIAKHFGTEIVSCDSRQFFKEMKIGTATPSLEELAQVKHHFIGLLSVADYYSIGQYEVDALHKLEEIFVEKDIIVLVGGSMMYEKAVTEGLNDLPEANAENQQKLEKIWKEEGLEKLQEILKNIDEDYYKVVHKENPRRLLRAIDVIWQTGRKYSEIIAEPKNKRNFRVVKIGITAPREIMYERINLRVDKMLENGLIDEVKSLVDFRNLVPLQTVGYTEIFKYLDGTWSLDFAIEEIKKNSRRYAKRQETWNKKVENVTWLNYDYSTEDLQKIFSIINP